MIRVVHNNRGRKDENLRNSNTHSSSSQLIVSLFNGFGTNGGPITILWEEAQALCAPEKGLSQQYGTQVGVANRILYVQGHYLDSVALRSLITQRGSPWAQSLSTSCALATATPGSPDYLKHSPRCWQFCRLRLWTGFNRSCEKVENSSEGASSIPLLRNEGEVPFDKVVIPRRNTISSCVAAERWNRVDVLRSHLTSRLLACSARSHRDAKIYVEAALLSLPQYTRTALILPAESNNLHPVATGRDFSVLSGFKTAME